MVGQFSQCRRRMYEPHNPILQQDSHQLLDAISEKTGIKFPSIFDSLFKS